jgi:hypothetical protein
MTPNLILRCLAFGTCGVRSFCHSVGCVVFFHLLAIRLCENIGKCGRKHVCGGNHQPAEYVTHRGIEIGSRIS